jgi:hypothetical protein
MLPCIAPLFSCTEVESIIHRHTSGNETFLVIGRRTTTFREIENVNYSGANVQNCQKRGGFSQKFESIEEMVLFSAPLKRLISEGQLIIRIRQIKQSKTNNFLNIFFFWKCWFCKYNF